MFLSSCVADTYLIRENDKWKLTVDPVDWYLTFPMDSFFAQQVIVKSDTSIAYFNLYSKDMNLQIEIFVEPTKECNSSESCRNHAWENQQKHLRNAKDIRMSSFGDAFSYEFTFPNEYGGQKHLSAFLYKDGYCIDVRLSQMPFKEKKYQQFIDFINGIEFEKKKIKMQ